MWELDYDGALLLRLPVDSTTSFQASSFYKLSLKRYVREVLSGFVRFKPALTYLDYKKVIVLCRKEAEKRQITLVIGTALSEYIESRELHIEIRSRLGVELKDHDPKLQERFESYRSIVDASMARKLREKQMWDSFFMCAMQKSANFSVPGSGKTASVLGMYAYLRQKELVKRIVVICPKNAFGSWIDEFTACFQRVFADAKEKHAMRYTHHRGLAAVTRWVRLKYAAMNLKKLANWSWNNSCFRTILTILLPYNTATPTFA